MNITYNITFFIKRKRENKNPPPLDYIQSHLFGVCGHKILTRSQDKDRAPPPIRFITIRSLSPWFFFNFENITSLWSASRIPIKNNFMDSSYIQILDLWKDPLNFVGIFICLRIFVRFYPNLFFYISQTLYMCKDPFFPHWTKFDDLL